MLGAWTSFAQPIFGRTSTRVRTVCVTHNFMSSVVSAPRSEVRTYEFSRETHTHGFHGASVGNQGPLALCLRLSSRDHERTVATCAKRFRIVIVIDRSMLPGLLSNCKATWCNIGCESRSPSRLSRMSYTKVLWLTIARVALGQHTGAYFVM